MVKKPLDIIWENYPIYLSPSYYLKPRIGLKVLCVDENGEEKAEDLDTDKKIDIYEDRVNRWFLDHAAKLSRESENSGFAIICLGLPHLEGMQQLKKGESSDRQSRDYTKNALREMFDIEEDNDVATDIIYEDLRNGLFHDGMSRGKISLSLDHDWSIKIIEEKTRLLVNPKLFVERISAKLDEYISKLRNKKNSELRNNFEKVWDRKYLGQPS